MRRSLCVSVLSLASAAAADLGWVGSKVCGGCHAEIYRTYATTPMAQTSGPAASAFVPEQSFLANGGYRYSVLRQDRNLFLDFRRGNTPALQRRQLSWFIGSGSAARSFLIAVDGFLYEAPATYYSGPQAWAPSPGYDRYSYPFLTRAIAPGCLQCHSTGVRPVAGTQNGYEAPPFLEGGVGCERCHGPGAVHAASRKRGDIVNPATLPSEERDSTCAQCHLSGEIRVDRSGKSMTGFVAGDKLSDYAVAFVRTGSLAGAKVTGHVESLAQSACSRGSGKRIWCGTCHDPHVVPAPAEKAAWYRSKCQTCHTASECGRGDDCVACHMPRTPVTDAEHVVSTDHSIPRRPSSRNKKASTEVTLSPFAGAQAGVRDQALAYAIVALREQNPAYSSRAFELLRHAYRQNPSDPQTLSYLADLYKTRNERQNAEDLYRKLYSLDPSQSSAPANLGAFQMEQGHNEEAIRLFREALRISPGLVLVRLNLVVALVRTGNSSEARSVLTKALELNPSFTAVRQLLEQLR